ncbi:T9SS type A sorting domain-containing protein [Neolewinella aurantiaca]|uniref:T9SS type A sorting domain-containing protein n=1 Tax=Neolewinella aurantiaca TaxID=2602767 RepID=A0A5C7FFL8_9BACT|nr:T9SS type A sorting domain-containing protein [Neolewinella aurantiaca]TXF88420.1 T9SS type A sorting domain-containing protein [Neolewinella aurantiaca]
MIRLFFFLVVSLPMAGFAQTITKPIGCYAGTNGTSEGALSHPGARGVLLTEKWSDVEASPGVFDFSLLDAKINTVKAAGLPYALAVAAGAFGSPAWLTESLNVAHHDFEYQGQEWKLPLWWDNVCAQRLSGLISQLGDRYAADSLLSHVYVTQMTVNGVEGHLNGVNIPAFTAAGFTDQKWITAAKATTALFATAFPGKPIVFEVHEINQDTLIPTTIINDLTNDPALCNRVGLGMWWLSGKTNYQPDLIDFILNYQGDKYAQVIGRSDQTERFEGELYSSVFEQAKLLGIRYIEPWPYEFINHTADDLIQDFNLWADARFSPSDTCNLVTSQNQITRLGGAVAIYPNPASRGFEVRTDFSYRNIVVMLFDAQGRLLRRSINQAYLGLDGLAAGVYFVRLTIDGSTVEKKIIKTD